MNEKLLVMSSSERVSSSRSRCSVVIFAVGHASGVCVQVELRTQSFETSGGVSTLPRLRPEIQPRSYIVEDSLKRAVDFVILGYQNEVVDSAGENEALGGKKTRMPSRDGVRDDVCR
jgi:hypothetical protein